jgi:cob(I)alamin adenosyltransferase
MAEPGAKTVRRKKLSSINVAIDLVKSGTATAFVSAGNTGAAVASATLKLRTLDGVQRPAIATLMPTEKTTPFILIDAGANIGSCSLVAVALGHPEDSLRAVLTGIQNDLFDAGADLATPIVENPERPPLRITESYIERLEQWCDQYNETLPALTSFILPGGTALSALLHVARTVARRAERSAWIAANAHPDTVSPLPARYLNRLSDLLFILSRVANAGDDVLWKPGGSR